MKSFLGICGRYLLWLINSFFGLYLLVRTRGLIIVLLEHFAVSESITYLVDRVGLLVLGIGVMVYIVYAEGVFSKRGWTTFFQHFAYQILIHTVVVYVERFVIHLHVPVFQWADLGAIGIYVAAALLSLYIYHRLTTHERDRKVRL